MGLTEPALFESDETVAQAAFRWSDQSARRRRSWNTLKQTGWAQLKLADAPFANGGFRTPSGKCEFYSERLAQQGLDPLARLSAALRIRRRRARTRRPLSARDDFAARPQLPEQHAS